MYQCICFIIWCVCVCGAGLPPDITPDEFVELMSKCGIIMRDPMTEEYKIKLYKDSEGNQKGDGLCCYLKVSDRETHTHTLIHTGTIFICVLMCVCV